MTPSKSVTIKITFKTGVIRFMSITEDNAYLFIRKVKFGGGKAEILNKIS